MAHDYNILEILDCYGPIREGYYLKGVTTYIIAAHDNSREAHVLAETSKGWELLGNFSLDVDFLPVSKGEAYKALRDWVHARHGM